LILDLQITYLILMDLNHSILAFRICVNNLQIQGVIIFADLTNQQDCKVAIFWFTFRNNTACSVDKVNLNIQKQNQPDITQIES
jgi:hypothetical protein